MSSQTIAPSELSAPGRVIPFLVSYLLIPAAWLSATQGGWAIVLLPVIAWYLFAAADFAIGTDSDNADLNATERDLAAYRWITLLWTPAQFLMLFSLLWYVPQADHLNSFELQAQYLSFGYVK